ncbi:hypothetical protein BH11BAC7_BH11BAC7_31850 [soil metagenome]
MKDFLDCGNSKINEDNSRSNYQPYKYGLQKSLPVNYNSAVGASCL